MTSAFSQLFRTILISGAVSGVVSGAITYGSLLHLKHLHHDAFQSIYQKHKQPKDDKNIGDKPIPKQFPFPVPVPVPRSFPLPTSFPYGVPTSLSTYLPPFPFKEQSGSNSSSGSALYKRLSSSIGASLPVPLSPGYEFPQE